MTTWRWTDTKRPLRWAEIIMPTAIWEELCTRFPDQLTACTGSTIRLLYPADGRTLQAVLRVREAHLHLILPCCDEIERQLTEKH